MGWFKVRGLELDKQIPPALIIQTYLSIFLVLDLVHNIGIDHDIHLEAKTLLEILLHAITILCKGLVIKVRHRLAQTECKRHPLSDFILAIGIERSGGSQGDPYIGQIGIVDLRECDGNPIPCIFEMLGKAFEEFWIKHALEFCVRAVLRMADILRKD